MQIYGTKTDDLTVKMTNKELSSTPWTTIYKVDPSLPAGATKEEQSPYRGRVVEAYRNVYDGEGNLVSSTLESKNTYKKRDRIILVSPYDGAQYGLTEADGAIITPAPTPSAPAETVPAETAPVETAPASTQPAESAVPSAAPSPSETMPDIGIPLASAPPAAEEGQT